MERMCGSQREQMDNKGKGKTQICILDFWLYYFKKMWSRNGSPAQ
jgi:hypothetical protein